MSQLKTWRFGIEDYIINFTKCNVNGVMTTGFVEFIKKSEPHIRSVDSYAILGVKVVKGNEYDKELIYLVNTDLINIKLYEMTIVMYDCHAEIEWFNSTTGILENKWSAVFLKTLEESYFNFPRTDFLFKNFDLIPNKHIYKSKNDLSTYLLEGTQLTKIEFDLSSLPNLVKGFKKSSLIFDILVNQSRIDNKWIHYNSKSSLGFMMYVKQKENYYEISLILTENEYAILFNIHKIDFSETEKLTLEKLQSSYVLNNLDSHERDVRNVLFFHENGNNNIRVTVDSRVWNKKSWQDGEIFVEVYDNDYNDLILEKRILYGPAQSLNTLENLKQEILSGRYNNY